MTKISLALAAVLAVASAMPNVAFAAMNNNPGAVQGHDINRCRAHEGPSIGSRHNRDARVACVQRLEHMHVASVCIL